MSDFIFTLADMCGVHVQFMRRKWSQLTNNVYENALLMASYSE